MKNFKQGNILIINLSDENFLEVILFLKGEKIVKRIKKSKGEFEYLLDAIKDIIKIKGIDLTDLDAVGAVSGKGSFTSARIAVVTTNILAYTLKIPAFIIKQKEFGKALDLSVLKNIKFQKYIEPKYACEPNITKAN